MGNRTREINKEDFLRKVMAYETKTRVDTKPRPTGCSLEEMISNAFEDISETDDKLVTSLWKTESEYTPSPYSCWNDPGINKYLTLKPRLSKSAQLETTFAASRDRWREETEFYSSIAKITSNQNYLEIIGMGEQAVPLILHELEERPSHWFVALTAILRVDPVPQEIRGDMRKMADMWLEYGRQQGWI